MSVATQVGGDDRLIAVLLGERFRPGGRSYGELALATDTRDFTREALACWAARIKREVGSP